MHTGAAAAIARQNMTSFFQNTKREDPNGQIGCFFTAEEISAHIDFVEMSDGDVCSYKLSCTLFIAPNSSSSKKQGRQRETSETAIKVRVLSKLEQPVS